MVAHFLAANTKETPMPKFRKKPVVIEAEQFFPDQKPWPAGVYPYWPAPAQPKHEGPREYRVDTLEGFHIASPGDWIITGVKDEKYPCKPDIFAATYEAVDDDH